MLCTTYPTPTTKTQRRPYDVAHRWMLDFNSLWLLKSAALLSETIFASE